MTDFADTLRRDTLAAYDMSLPPSLLVGPATSTIAALVPNTAPLATRPATVAVNGTGYAVGAVIHVNGVAVPTVRVWATQLTTTHFATAPVGVYTVTVTNPSERPSNSATFTTTATQAEGETTEETTAPSDTGTGTVSGGRRRARPV